MKLLELNPKYATTEEFRTHIVFDCPKCKQHRISVPIEGKVRWEVSGIFPELTLSPSIAHNNGVGCESHFFIREGEIINA